jgi:hypothetical protein
MKKIWCLMLLLVLLATGICTANIPNLLGNWTGSWSGYDEAKGYTNLTSSGTINFTFTEQKGRIFNGNLTANPKNGTKLNQGFAGAISLDNKTLNIAEFGKGYATGTVISNNEIEIIYLSDEKNGSVAVDELHRVTT